MAPALFWFIVFAGLILPLLHVVFSPRGGPWLSPRGSRCPLGPRLGWIVVILFLGPIGWLMYMRARSKRGRASAGPVSGS